MCSAATAQSGFFGKLPARGDFVERRLDRTFCQAFDDWMQAGMIASKAQLADAWLPAYLETPLWRFAIAAGTCGPRATAGVMMPSVDRVGRYYPLIVATHAQGAPSATTLATHAETWFTTAEQTILGALEEDCSFEQFDETIAALAPLHPTPPAAAPATGSLWWTFGSDHMQPAALACERMPAPETFAVFIDDDHETWGWHAAPGQTFQDLPLFRP